jgi:hypothetical protein
MTTIAVGPALFKNYNTFLTWSVFAIVTWVTLLIGFPFTVQYAREQAPREVWDHRLFMHLNVILTVVFGLMFTVNAGFGVIALMTGHLLTLGLLLPISQLIACIVSARNIRNAIPSASRLIGSLCRLQRRGVRMTNQGPREVHVILHPKEIFNGARYAGSEIEGRKGASLAGSMAAGLDSDHCLAGSPGGSLLDLVFFCVPESDAGRAEAPRKLACRFRCGGVQSRF